MKSTRKYAGLSNSKLKEGSNKEERKEGKKERERKKDKERKETITCLKRSVLCFDSPSSELEFWDIYSVKGKVSWVFLPLLLKIVKLDLHIATK